MTVPVQIDVEDTTAKTAPVAHPAGGKDRGFSPVNVFSHTVLIAWRRPASENDRMSSPSSRIRPLSTS